MAYEKRFVPYEVFYTPHPQLTPQQNRNRMELCAVWYYYEYEKQRVDPNYEIQPWPDMLIVSSTNCHAGRTHF